MLVKQYARLHLKSQLRSWTTVLLLLPTGSVPPKVSVKVVEARAPVVREDGSSNRHVVVEGGANVLVPAHIAKGDTILVSTDDGTYAGKA
jgi:hypothetical protein